jgi:alpha-N-arabinofuranosidase
VSCDLGNDFCKLVAKIVTCVGGCFVEGDRLINSFRWRETVGPYEERPGHYGDVWNYWTDDGFGFFEGLQVTLTPPPPLRIYCLVGLCSVC